MVVNGRSTCAGAKRTGQSCTAVATIDGYCIGHAPDLEEKRQEARKLGGRNKATIRRAENLMPARLAPVANLLEKALQEVHTGDLDPKVGHALASLTGALVRVVTSGELEERLRALESKIDSRGDGLSRETPGS